MSNRRRWLAPALLAALLAAAGCTAASDPAGGPPASSEQPGGDEVDGGTGGGGESPAGQDSPGSEPPGSGEGSDQPGTTGIGMDRPQTTEATILLEGTEEAIPVRLFATPEDWPLQFSTYHPEAWLAETETRAEGAVVRFTANYEGQRNDDVYLEVVVYPEGTGEDAARQQAADLAADLGIEASERRFSWSVEEYAGLSDVVQGIALGRHGDGWFHVFWHYPPEHGDGFGPRWHLVFSEWLWADNGLPLDPGK